MDFRVYKLRNISRTRLRAVRGRWNRHPRRKQKPTGKKKEFVRKLKFALRKFNHYKGYIFSYIQLLKSFVPPCLLCMISEPKYNNTQELIKTRKCWERI